MRSLIAEAIARNLGGSWIASLLICDTHQISTAQPHRLDALGADRIATVWQSAAWPEVKPAPYKPTADGHWDLWYPGDDVVDWVGLSTFYGDSFDNHRWACVPDENIAALPRAVRAAGGRRGAAP